MTVNKGLKKNYRHEEHNDFKSTDKPSYTAAA